MASFIKWLDEIVHTIQQHFIDTNYKYETILQILNRDRFDISVSKKITGHASLQNKNGK